MNLSSAYLQETKPFLTLNQTAITELKEWTRKRVMRFSPEEIVVIKFEGHRFGADLVLILYNRSKLKHQAFGTSSRQMTYM